MPKTAPEWIRIENPAVGLCFKEDGQPGLLFSGVDTITKRETRIEVYGSKKQLEELLELTQAPKGRNV